MHAWQHVNCMTIIQRYKFKKLFIKGMEDTSMQWPVCNLYPGLCQDLCQCNLNCAFWLVMNFYTRSSVQCIFVCRLVRCKGYGQCEWSEIFALSSAPQNLWADRTRQWFWQHSISCISYGMPYPPIFFRSLFVRKKMFFWQVTQHVVGQLTTYW